MQMSSLYGTQGRDMPRQGIFKRFGKLFCASALAMAVLAAPHIGTTDAVARAAPESFADIIAPLLPAVVNVSTTQIIKGQDPRNMLPAFPPGSPFNDFLKEHFGGQKGRPYKAASLGSGVIIDASGFVVTNNHVIDGADEIQITTHDDQTYDAKLIGRDEKTDLALLKIERDAPFPFVEFGKSSESRIGDWVVAVGNPFGLGGSVSAGIISSVGRDIHAGPYDNFIQTDAAINRGNSGGPLFNIKGEIIGINTAIYSNNGGGSVGIGFSIPSDTVKGVVDDLKKFGRTRRGWLGVRIQNVDESIADSLELGEARGALIAGVSADGPAAKADIQKGDIILKFDGKTVREMRELPRIVANTDIGKQVTVEIWRKGKVIKRNVRLGELEKAEADGKLDDLRSDRGRATDQGGVVELDAIGLKVKTIDADDRRRYRLPEDKNGVVIVDVDDESDAYEKGVRAGTLLLNVQNKDVTKASEVAAIIEKRRKSDHNTVLLMLEVGNLSQYVALKLK
jgi:serine protease Do